MIIGICGGTGSGKTTIAQRVVERVGYENLVLIQQDSYYLNLADVPLDERRRVNFDHPNSLDFDLIAKHLSALKNGEAIEIPTYDFKTHTRNEETIHAEPTSVVVVEGILIFAEARVADLLDVKVFVDTPDDIRLLRRIKRDINERGRTLDQTLAQYEKTIRPMHYEFVVPSKGKADIIIPNNGNSEVAVDLICGLVSGKTTGDQILVSL